MIKVIIKVEIFLSNSIEILIPLTLFTIFKKKNKQI